MRLFVALLPPPEVVEHLAVFAEPRRSYPDDDLRWAADENWHLTLAFLGDVAEHKADDLAERLELAARRRAPLGLWLQGAGAYPDAARGRVLWAGVHGDTDTLSHLAAGARAAANKAGVEVSGRRFTPHVTLARTRRPLELTRWIRIFDGYRGPAWTAESLRLVSSRLGEGPDRGAAYDTVGEWPFLG